MSRAVGSTAGAPPTPDKVDVQLSPDGKIRVYDFRGTVDIVLDVVGYYTKASLADLQARLLAAESTIATLQSASASQQSAIGALSAATPFVESFEDEGLVAEDIPGSISPTEVGAVTIAGTKTFAVSSGSTTTVRLFCCGPNSTSLDVYDVTLMAIFTA